MIPTTILSKFSTPSYQGVWFRFTGDRMALRGEIERFLQAELNLLSALRVDERGPHFAGLRGISYSHTDGMALLVYSQTHEVGVDLELSARHLKREPREIVERFFHPEERQTITTEAQILTRWIQKEAYAKYTRKGLTHALAVNLNPLVEGLGIGDKQPVFNKIAKIPVGYEAWVCLAACC